MSDRDEGTPPERSSAGWTTGKSVAMPQPAITVDVPLGGQRIQRFLDELGSDAPTPAGAPGPASRRQPARRFDRRWSPA